MDEGSEEEDEQVKNQKMPEMMEQQSNKYNASDAMGDRVKDLVEWIETGVFCRGYRISDFCINTVML